MSISFPALKQVHTPIDLYPSGGSIALYFSSKPSEKSFQPGHGEIFELEDCHHNPSVGVNDYVPVSPVSSI